MAEGRDDELLPGALLTGVRGRILRFYGKILDLIVIGLIFVMLLTLLAAVAGLVLDFWATALALRQEAAVQNLVTDVLSVFVLIELFRTFTDYLEFHRIRLRVLSEVAIVFVLREIFIGLYAHRMEPPEILAIAVLLAVLVAARVAAVYFAPRRADMD
ncbi:phosphate-starvation-inducible PsiE family protein [Acidithiobacillus sp.]